MAWTAHRLKDEARALGFDEARLCAVDAPWPAAGRLAAFIEAGRHGTMDWIAETAERRAHPRHLWPEAQTALVVGMNYGPASDPLAALAHKDRAAISVYAQNADYHDVLKKRLKQLARAFQHAGGATVKVFVDTAPLMEKPLAERAGAGWQGKHTNLVSRTHGSWLFLGVMLTDAALEPDPPEADHCGSCRACLDICPTRAFPAPYQLDARRCLSYLTIEHKGPIPREFRQPLGNRIYGCDDCLAACPWNKFAQTAREAAFHPRAELQAPRLADLAALNAADFRTFFSKSPIKRIGRDRFLRNVLIAIGNTGDRDLLPVVRARLEDESALVRGAEVWALAQLDPSAFKAERARRRESEHDPSVQAEWAERDHDPDPSDQAANRSS